MKNLLVFLFLLFLTAPSFSQEPKLTNLDSSLTFNQNRTLLLMEVSDSLQLLDSLQAEVLKEEIDRLQNSEVSRRQTLQSKIDSLNRRKAEQKIMIQHQVDSLRAVNVGVPMTFNGDTLFYIYSKLGPFGPSQRAESIAHKLQMLGDRDDFDADKLIVTTGAESDDISYEEIIILSVTDTDGFWINEPRSQIIQAYREQIVESLADYRSHFGVYNNIRRFVLLLLVLLILFLGIKYMNRGFTALNIKLLEHSDQYLSGLKIKQIEVLTPEREKQVLRMVLKGVKWLLIILIVYIALPTVFSLFPATENLANQLFGYIINPVKAIVLGFLGYIPEMITIAVIITVAYYVTRFLKVVAREIENENIVINGFYADWAKPTFNLVSIIIFAFSFIAIFPYLPGSDSPVFKGVSVFLGILISLGSTSAVSNIIAGLVITYMRPFKLGDRVKIGDTTGDVMSKNLLVTRVKTIKNEDISIPNSAILNGSTINFSSNENTIGLILNSTVSIGYDVPWRKVHELLINSALKTEFISKSPTPFVLQTSLDDFYVSYQINMYTNKAGSSANIYSALHSHIQDSFAEAGVEIMSPHYRAERDGSEITIPKGFKPGDEPNHVNPKE